MSCVDPASRLVDSLSSIVHRLVNTDEVYIYVLCHPKSERLRHLQDLFLAMTTKGRRYSHLVVSDADRAVPLGLL